MQMTGENATRRRWTENKELVQMLQARKLTAEITAKLDRTQQAILRVCNISIKKVFGKTPQLAGEGKE